MQATLTLEAFNFIPEPIRRRLNLSPGTVLEFDEQTPFLKAVPTPMPAQDNFQTWLAGSVGLAKSKFTTDERMAETRGED
jgi:bifunctional DNA-binding transcriptional regulator/antitoxin component of YhaV-PrlF toxin-antitoxin module